MATSNANAGGTGEQDPDPNNPDPNNPDGGKKDPPDNKNPADPLATLKAEDQALVTKLIEDKVKESIKDIKTKLDSAFTARDDALRKLEEIDRKKREKELKDLEDNGKHKEAFDIKIKEANEKQTTLELENKALKEQLKTQARDADVKSLLSGLKFRNPKALDMAFKEISNQLVLNDKGDWVHRSGVLLNDFVVTFAKDEANSFLFEPEVSSGAGTSKPGASNGSPTGKSLFALPQTEVLKMAAEGRLPNRK